MQTYTHLIGGALTSLIFRGNVPAQIACMAGAVLPDLCMIPPFAWDLVNGRKPLEKQGPITKQLKLVCHSIPMSGILGLIALFIWLPLGLFLLSITLHGAIDELTHGKGKDKVDHESCFWPFENKLEKFRKSFGLWDYRIGTGNLIPKPFEFFLDLAMIVTILCIIWPF